MYIDLVYCYNDRIGSAILEAPRFCYLHEGDIISDKFDTTYEVIRVITLDTDRDEYKFIKQVWSDNDDFMKAQSYFKKHDFEYRKEVE